MNDNGITSWEKLAFWLAVGVISTFFAEVLSGSTPFPFFTPEGWLIVYPVYTLHTFVLATIVLKFGRPTFYALYPAGMIFGMYETYMTKVVWGAAEWSRNGPSFMGVFLFPFLLVVLFWHPFMSFIIPLIASDKFLLGGDYVLSHMPGRFIRWLKRGNNFRTFALLLGVFIAISGMINLTPFIAIFSLFASLIFVVFIVYLFRRMYRGHELVDYVPGRMGLGIGISLLLFLYMVYFFVFNPEYLLSPNTHMFTLLIYMLMCILLIVNLKRSRAEKIDGGANFRISWKLLACLVLIFAVLEPLEAAFPGKMFIFAIAMVAESIIGIVSLIYTIIPWIRIGWSCARGV